MASRASRGFIPGNVVTKSVKGEACRRPCNPWSSTTRARRSPTTSGCTPATACHSSGAPSGRQIPSRWRISHPPAMEASSPNPSLSSQASSGLVNGFCDLGNSYLFILVQCHLSTSTLQCRPVCVSFKAAAEGSQRNSLPIRSWIHGASRLRGLWWRSSTVSICIKYLWWATYLCLSGAIRVCPRL